MYIPKQFLNTDEESNLAFMKKYSFGTLVTIEKEQPIATHLPFLIDKTENGIVISSHFSKANPQVEALTKGTAMVIFSEPHAYVSPKHYESQLSVPTWNYLAVHAYGKATIIEGQKQSFDLLEKMILHYESEYLDQWNNMPQEHRLKMLNGIVAFQIEVTSLQAQNKLSQNKSVAEKDRIITAFDNSANPNEVEIARYMRIQNNKE
jgi:transcriptional regulator